MLKEVLQEDLEKGRILHDKIKNHLFRKSPERYLLDEYAKLFEDVNDVFGAYVHEEYDNENHCWKYRYYRSVRDRWLHYVCSSNPDGYFHYNDAAEIYTNPNIAIMDYAMHDFRGILWKLQDSQDLSIRPGLQSATRHTWHFHTLPQTGTCRSLQPFHQSGSW